MTEIETLKRAKMYMEKLARGINPIDDSQIPDNEVTNNVRLSRCFLYISDVLTNIIQKEENNSKKKRKKRAFLISQEQILKYEYVKQPISIQDFASKINELIDTTVMKGLSANRIIKWLISIQLVCEEYNSSTNRKIRKPTRMGTEIGITSDRRISQNGYEYFVLLLDEQAQRFVVDNLNGVIEYSEEPKEGVENQGKPWNEEQDQILIQLFKEGKKIDEIASVFKRTTGGIQARLKKIGLIKWIIYTKPRYYVGAIFMQ